jgi:RNA recognition motif-containing protein
LFLFCYCFSFAYLEFATPQLADKYYKELQNKKIRNKEIVIDYVDERSSYVKSEEKENKKKEAANREQDLKRLHVSGFDKTATEADLKKIFNGFTEFTLPLKKTSKLNIG